MARSKQATPIRRETSSEYISKGSWEPLNGDVAVREANGTTNGKAPESQPELEKKDAGLPQLVVAVAGIYASLYATTALPVTLLACRYGSQIQKPADRWLSRTASHGPTSKRS